MPEATKYKYDSAEGQVAQLVFRHMFDRTFGRGFETLSFFIQRRRESSFELVTLTP
jgi:hypothetical protein